MDFHEFKKSALEFLWKSTLAAIWLSFDFAIFTLATWFIHQLERQQNLYHNQLWWGSFKISYLADSLHAGALAAYGILSIWHFVKVMKK